MPSLYDLFASMGYFAKFIVFVLAFKIGRASCRERV